MMCNAANNRARSRSAIHSEVTCVMALPRRCAASLRLAVTEPFSFQGLRPRSETARLMESFPASQILAAHQHGGAIPKVL